MKLVEINWNPTDRQLRQFGVICLFALPFLGWLWIGSPLVVGVAAIVGLLIGITGWIRPNAIKPMFFALTLIATPIGMVVGELAMFLIYVGVFLPIGIAFKIARRDALDRQFDRQATTYWQPRKQPRSAESYYHQS